MKLDEVNKKSNEKNTPTITALFKNSPCRKNLQLNNVNSPTGTDLVKSPLMKKHVQTTASRRDSIDCVIDEVAKGGDESDKMDTDSAITQDKENECITLE